MARSRPLRALAIGAAFVAAVVCFTSTWVLALSLSTSQRAAATLGDTSTSISILNPPSQPPGEAPAPTPAWITDLAQKDNGVIAVRVAQFPAHVGGSTHLVDYTETHFPSPAYDSRALLTSGTWPVSSGQCVLAGPGQFAGPVLGEWPLSIVGSASSPYQPDTNLLMCAPGTWQLWQVAPDEAIVAGTRATTEYYLTGPEPTSDAMLRASVATQATGGVDFSLVSSFIERTSPQRVLSDTIPFLTLPLVVCSILASLAMRWATRVSRHLYLAGLPTRVVRRTVLGSMLAVAAASGFAGATTGAMAAWLLRPLLHLMRHTPLNDTPPSYIPIAATAVTCFLGAALGAGIASAAPRLHASPRHNTALPAITRYLPLLAVTLVCVGAVTITLSDGAYSSMLLGAATITTGCALASPAVTQRLLRPRSWRVTYPRELTARLRQEDLRRWTITSLAWALVVGLMCSIASLATSSVAGAQAAMTSAMPAGSAALATQPPSGQPAPSKRVIARFENDIGISAPVSVEHGLTWPGVGYVWCFDSLGSMERVLGTLPPSDRTAVSAGAALSAYATKPTQIDAATATGQRQSLQVLPVPVSAARYAAGGFALKREAGCGPATWTWNVYTGLTPNQDIAARNWTNSTGLRGVYVESYRFIPQLSLPTWTLVSLIGFGALAVPLLVYGARGEARALRPVFAELWCLGIPRRFQTRVLARLLGTTVIVAFVLGIAGSALSQAILALVYPGTVFNPMGVPWWQLLVFGLTLTVAAVTAAHLATGRLSRAEAAPML